MVSRDEISLPAGWEIDFWGESNTTFRNEIEGLNVEVTASYNSSRVQKHPRKLKHYKIKLSQDWFSKGVRGDLQMDAKVKSREQALAMAVNFMKEYTTERDSQSDEEIEVVHRSFGKDHEIADDLLVSEAASEAFTDAIGYSTDLLLDTLKSLTNDQHHSVVHRNGKSLDVVYEKDPSTEFKDMVAQIWGVFPIDRRGISHILDQELPITLTLHLREFTVYRFIFAENKETIILLKRGTVVTSPTFEHTIENVLEEKWK